MYLYSLTVVHGRGFYWKGCEGGGVHAMSITQCWSGKQSLRSVGGWHDLEMYGWEASCQVGLSGSVISTVYVRKHHETSVPFRTSDK